jgi:serine/threonine-protein kinase
MGVVYRVRHVHTGEALALKGLHGQVLRDASAVERFRREARVPARIGSEHVARVTDADTAPELGDAPFYVMELLEGTDLERLVNDRGPLPQPFAVELLRQAARALDKAHAMGIVHRDLKPENLFLTYP